ncbi:interactor of little elongation complex ELL subunit 1 [Rhinolophus ferrumequinum]|uniref:Interactor of little elongation complex ELL subunit 1 n=1 Tax=Rhinolophus ferrumequinum TaxID=59479 RepID=A0A7J7Y4S5_RHIFE|nr:interactor of little elongation complex ELL subunit 1 [Rhinolophus ferrumequinum]
MMPGETHSAAPGTAADLSRCQGCASLQQNLNEYVEALIALKQKIINTDNLLTEYQKKFLQLQFARRENSTLHQQVEQMLQKISPLQRCQEELGSLKAELEEKKSSLKLYQDTHQEYARVKEECLKTDAQKKKLEAKVKKLEEAAIKQIQDFKQLRNEKKVLEKEFKKTQERLDEFSKQKNEKELRNIGTQISSDSYGSIDKRKVKLLLKELWLCINTTHRVPGEGSRCVPERPAQEEPQLRDPREAGVPAAGGGGPLRASAVQTCLAELSMEIEGDFSACENVEREGLPGAAPQNEDQIPGALTKHGHDTDGADFSDHERLFDEDLQAAVDFFKLPPPLLSPVPSPPLGSAPPLGTLPSALAPETYFGEYADSSDNDSAQHRTSAESASEAEALVADDSPGSSRKTKGRGAHTGKLRPRDAAQVPSTWKANEVTAVGFGTFTATLREPSATYSLACEKHWTVSSPPASDRHGGVLDEATRQREAREMEKSVQMEEALHKPLGSTSVEKLPGSLAQEKEAALGRSDLLYCPLGQRPLSEFLGSEGKIMASSKSDFTKWTPAIEITSESDRVSVSDRLQGTARESGKGRGAMRGFVLGESPGQEEDAGDVMAVTGLDVSVRCPSSATSGALSVYIHPQASSGLQCGDETPVPPEAVPTAVCHSEQTSQAKTSDTAGQQAEPPECAAGERDPGTRVHALCPELGVPDLHGQSSSEVGRAEAVKSTSQVCTLPLSVFAKATRGGQGENQGLQGGLTPSQSDFTPLVESQSGLIKRVFGFVRSTSWHHSDLLRRGGEERLRAKSEHEQETHHQLQKAVASLENRGSASKPDLPGESAGAVGFRAAASMLPNQVSVITKQARPERTHGARPEPLSLPRSEPASATESVRNGTGYVSSRARCGGEGEDAAQEVQEVAPVERTVPEASPSWRKLDFNSPSGSLSVENSHCSTNSKLPFFSENTPVPNQDVMMEPAVQEEMQKQRPCLNATNLDTSGLGGDQHPAAGMAVAGACPTEDAPFGDRAGPDGEGAALAEDCPRIRQSPERPKQLPSPSPGSACPEGPGPTAAAFSSATGRKDETHAVPQRSPPGPLYCYTGLREAGGGDTELESEAPSCSEGENEPDAAPGARPWGAVQASGTDLGAGGAAATEPRPSTALGCLTSALRDCNISALPETDGLSTSEVVQFLESCQLRDYSSGDSVSECSSKETLNKEMNRELKPSGKTGAKCRKQLGEQEALETSEEWLESEDEEGPLRSASRLAQCSLETLSEVLSTIGRELQPDAEDPSRNEVADLLLLSVHGGATSELGKERAKAPETGGSSPPSDPPPPSLDAQGTSPVTGTSSDENTQHILEGPSDVTRPVDGGDGVLSEPVGPPAQGCDSGAGQTAECSAGGEADRTFQCQISTVTSEVINVLINKDQNLVIEKGDNWTIINGVALVPDVDQVILCDAPGEIPASPEGGGLAAGFMPDTSRVTSPDPGHTGSPFQEPPCGGSLPGAQEEISSSGQSSNFDKSRLRNRPVKPSVRINSEIYDQIFESQIVASDHTYYNSKLEPFSKTKTRSKISNKDQSNKPVKTSASSRVESDPSEVSRSPSGDRGTTKTPKHPPQTILANADTSTPTDCSADTLSKIRQEVGPPLPPLLAPLIATPPRTSRPVSPLMSSASPSSPTSPASQLSPLCDIPAPPVTSPLLEDPGPVSPLCTPPSPSAVPTGERTLSSPLQFCAATPKHALPVPGRLPPCASAHTAVAGPQENSVKILDTMYPELSARARTLSILKGNIQLTRGPPAAARQDLPGPVSAITGFKGITSTSTAFVKTGGSSGGDCNQEKSRDVGTPQDSGGKRALAVCALRSAKRLRLDSESPDAETGSATAEGVQKHPRRDLPQAQVPAADEDPASVPRAGTASQLPLNPKETVESHDRAIADALKKIAESCFDLLPVIRSHVYVGNISKKPVMRDEEKEVVYDFSTAKKHLAECLLHSILSELKLQKVSLEHNYIHALCRVYVGLCRQLGDVERARLFCYSLLKEDFPESEKLTLFIVNMWHDVFVSQSVINKAMQLVARQRAKGEVLSCLRAFLSWEKNAPADVGFMVSKLLLTIQLCPKTEFQLSERFGEDLSDSTWEYIFAIELLCCYQKWVWTHDNIISKELWPVMDKWIKYRKGHANIAYTPDVIIASVLRLIGRLGQLGLKEGFPSAVKNISSVIGMFIQHARDEDIPWGIQLAAVYALCDLSPSNPAEISQILEAWRRETSHSVPPVVASSLEEVSALCGEGLG